LPSGTVSEAVAQEVAAGASVRIYVEMSTIGGSAQRRVEATMARRGITPVDCPISGGPISRWACGRRRRWGLPM